MNLELLAIFILLGLFVGFMAGLLGIGGGGILVPILTTIFLYMKLPAEFVVHLALGTSMGCIIITSISSFQAHHRHGNVRWDLVKVMVPGVVIGTFSGTFLASNLSAKPLAIFFSIFMAYIAVQMFFDLKPNKSQKTPNHYELIMVSSFIGVISALVSIGGGSLTVPYLNWRYADIKKAIGTSAALGFPIAVSGSIGYFLNGISVQTNLAYSSGFVYVPAVIFVSIPSYFTAGIGAKFAHQMPVRKLKKIFGILLIILSIKMLMLIF